MDHKQRDSTSPRNRKRKREPISSSSEEQELDEEATSTPIEKWTELIAVYHAISDCTHERVNQCSSAADDPTSTTRKKATLSNLERTFCSMLLQNLKQIIEHKNSILVQNDKAILEKRFAEQKLNELQSELFQIKMKMQHLKGDCVALEKKGTKLKQEWERLNSANSMICKLERLCSGEPMVARHEDKEG